MFDLKKFLSENRIPLHEANDFASTRTEIAHALQDLSDRVQKATYTSEIKKANIVLNQFSSEVSKLTAKWSSASKKL